MRKVLEVSVPKVPPRTRTDDVLPALGRLVLAWSGSEFELAMLLARLMAKPDTSKIKSVDAKTGIAEVESAILDTAAIFSIYFSVDSSRGRRDMVRGLIGARLGDQSISKEWASDVSDHLDEHNKLARQRNRYIHTAMGNTNDGGYVSIDERLLVKAIQPGTKHWLLKGQIKVTANAIDDLSDRLSEWIDKARELSRSMTYNLPRDRSRPSG